MIYITEGCSLRSGIYEIVNKQTGFRYVGQAKEFKARWNQHRQTLRNGIHQNKHLLGSYKRWVEILGHDDFLHFGIVEVMDGSTKEDRNIREEYWINKAISNEIILYNKRLEPTKESKVYSHNPAETRRKISNHPNGMKGKIPWNKGKKMPDISGPKHPMFGKPMPESTKQKIIEANKNRDPWNKGKTNHLSEESIQKMSIAGKGREPANKGKKCPQEAKEKISKANLGRVSPMKGKATSDIVKAKQRLAKLGKKLCEEVKNRRKIAFLENFANKPYPTAKKYTDLQLQAPDGKIYTEIENLSLFCREHNLQNKNLHKVLNRERLSHKGWKLLCVPQLPAEMNIL